MLIFDQNAFFYSFPLFAYLSSFPLIPEFFLNREQGVEVAVEVGKEEILLREK